MANFGVNFADFAQGLMSGFEAGQRAGYRNIATRKAKHELEKETAYDEILKSVDTGGVPANKKEKGFLGRAADAVLSVFDRAQPTTTAPAAGGTEPTSSATGSVDYTMQTRGQSTEPAPGAIPEPTKRQFGINPDQPAADEGTSRSAFSWQGGAPPSGASPGSSPGGAPPLGSSGAVPPPGVAPRSAAPSPEAVEAANRAVIAAGGKPSTMPSDSSVPASAGAPLGVRPTPYSATTPLTDQTAPGTESGRVDQLGLPGGPTAIPVAGQQPPGQRALGPAQPTTQEGTYPSDVGAPARRVGSDMTGRPGAIPEAGQPVAEARGTSDYRMDTAQAPANDFQLGPERPPGAVKTPEDQRREAEAVRLANRPKAPGQQPPDLIKAIVPQGSPEGTLPTKGDLQKYLDIVPKLMKIDPERALRLQAGVMEALRTGTMHGIMQAQIAFEMGDTARAQKALMLTYNRYIAPTSGDYAQFTMGKDGKSMTMVRFDQDTGKPLDTTPQPVTMDMLTKLGVMATSPQAWAQYVHQRDVLDETKRAHNMEAGARAAALKQSEAHFQATMQMHKDQFTLQMKKYDLAEKKADAAAARQAKLDATTEEKHRLEIEKAKREAAQADADKFGLGFTRPSNAKITADRTALDAFFSDPVYAKAPPETKAAATTFATSMLAFNSKMSPQDAGLLGMKLATGEVKLKLEDGPEGEGYSIFKYNNRKIAIPDGMVPQAPSVSPTTTGLMLNPPAATAKPGKPAIPEPPRQTEPRSIDELGKLPATPPRAPANDDVVSRFRRTEQQATPNAAQAQQQAMDKAKPLVESAVQQIAQLPPAHRGEAAKRAAKDIHDQTGADENQLFNQLYTAVKQRAVR